MRSVTPKLSRWMRFEKTTITSIFADMQILHHHLNSLMLRQSLGVAFQSPRVEDEYIQETLQGMDVSCVFVRRDNEYYDFKPEIETKEQIRDHLGDADQSVVTQFERWWDKYRVSLHQIDVQVKESEEVMWGYLKELGYE